MAFKIPRTTRALVVKKSPPERVPVYHDAIVQEQPIPALKPGELLVKMGAVAFNRRDLWIRKGMYPGIAFGSTFGADGAGMVIASTNPQDRLLRQRVFLTPMRGWECDPDGPESSFGVLGGSSFTALGTFSEYVVVPCGEVVQTPLHLTDEQIAAWPLAGLTAWRAIAQARITRGSTVLITGIGGGVAILGLQLCVSIGANVYVTSGSQEKIDKATNIGARGGVLYSNHAWPSALEALLKQNNHSRLDAVIDSGGDDILRRTSGILKSGGHVVCYGMTTGSGITMSMREVMRNQRLIGSSMGSRADLLAATHFLSEKKIVPMVAAVLPGLKAAEAGFEMMERGSQFGKIVVSMTQLSPGDADQGAATRARM